VKVAAAHHETNPDEIGIHVQDRDGVCLSLGKDQPWIHLTWACARNLVRVLGDVAGVKMLEGGR
jgi:hypothetical protein